MTGAEIKSLLADLGIGTRQLAAKLDVPPEVVLAWQKEELFPTKRHVEAMRALAARSAPESEPHEEPKMAPIAGAALLTGLQDPAFWTLLRKLLAHPALREEVTKAAAKYSDPAENVGEQTK